MGIFEDFITKAVSDCVNATGDGEAPAAWVPPALSRYHVNAAGRDGNVRFLADFPDLQAAQASAEGWAATYPAYCVFVTDSDDEERGDLRYSPRPCPRCREEIDAEESECYSCHERRERREARNDAGAGEV